MAIEFNMQMAVKNIIAIRKKAKPEDVANGIAWYAEAYEECRIMADRFRLPINVIAGVVAALSPNNRWELNLRNAKDLIDAYLVGGTMDDVSVCILNSTVITLLLQDCICTSGLIAIVPCIFGRVILE